MLSPSSVPELAKLLGFLGNEQRLNILKALARDEKFAREISEEVGSSRPLVNKYLKQFEKAGLVTGTNRVSEEAPYLKRYYRAVPFELVVNLDLIRELGDDSCGFQNHQRISLADKECDCVNGIVCRTVSHRSSGDCPPAR